MVNNEWLIKHIPCKCWWIMIDPIYSFSLSLPASSSEQAPSITLRSSCLQATTSWWFAQGVIDRSLISNDSLFACLHSLVCAQLTTRSNRPRINMFAGKCGNCLSQPEGTQKNYEKLMFFSWRLGDQVPLNAQNLRVARVARFTITPPQTISTNLWPLP